MGKKILILSSSSRAGGNSDVLCDEFIKGAQEVGHQTQKIALRDKNINFCSGCGACYTTKKCILKDDMTDMLDYIINADVILLATPVYFYTMCARMKNFIDRCCPRYPEISNKEFYLIATAADTKPQALERTIEEFRGFLDCLENPKEMGAIYATAVFHKGEVQKTNFMRMAYEMGKKV